MNTTFVNENFYFRAILFLKWVMFVGKGNAHVCRDLWLTLDVIPCEYSQFF